jgi:hypothetical protein
MLFKQLAVGYYHNTRNTTKQQNITSGTTVIRRNVDSIKGAPALPFHDVGEATVAFTSH